MMEYAQLEVWGNIPWKYELNLFSGLGGDVRTIFDNQSNMNKGMDEQPKIKWLIEITRFALI